MYFPDLKSIRKMATDMACNTKPYKGIIPTNEEELPLARKQLAKYVRDERKAEVLAMEIELAVSESDYKEKMLQGLRIKMGMFF